MDSRIAALEREAREHKSRVRYHRSRLHECMNELSTLRSIANRLELQFIGEGEHHGQSAGHQHQNGTGHDHD